MKYEHSILERSTKSKVKPAVRGPLTRINGGTPALVPVVLYPIQIAALAFGGATLLNARGGVFCQGVLTGIFGAQFNALGCFLVQALGGAGGSAHIAQAQYHHGFELMALAHLHDIARLDFFGGLGRRLIDMDSAFDQFIAGQGSGFKKPGGPKPLVNAHGLN